MSQIDSPAFYPERELERHGLTPDDWDTAGCYALALDTPDDANAFLEAWADEYDHAPPVSLPLAISYGYDIYYVGATGCLRDRLHDHVAGDVRRVRLIGVCPPVAVVDVWTYGDYDEAEDHEHQHAYDLRDEREGVVCWVNGSVV